jgi:hypothetical protein
MPAPTSLLYLHIGIAPNGEMTLQQNNRSEHTADKNLDFLRQGQVKTLSEIRWTEERATGNLYLFNEIETHLLSAKQNLNLKNKKATASTFLIVTTSDLTSTNRPWLPALNQAIQQLDRAQKANKTYEYEQALNQYKTLREKSNHSHLYQISITALSEHPTDGQHLLETLINNLISDNTPQRPTIQTYPADHPRFQQHLDALQNQTPLPLSELTPEQKRIADLPITEAIPVKSGSRLGRLNDKSLGARPQLSQQFRTTFNLGGDQPKTAISPGQTPTPDTQKPNQNDSALTRNPGQSLLSLRRKNDEPTYKMGDLRPLSNIFTLAFRNRLIEVVEQLAEQLQQTHQATSANTALQTVVTLDHFRQNHLDLITPDQYIVGIDPNETPIVSSFADIPHRFIAGATGAGKSNFVKFLLYQLFTADPTRTVWLADFKGGEDFRCANDFCPGLKVVSDFDDFGELLEDLWKQHEQRKAGSNQGVTAKLEKIKQLLQQGISLDDIDEDALVDTPQTFSRNILIIDEMAQLSNLKADRNKRDLAKEIELNLNKIARLGRSTGTHLICCTQSQEIEHVPTDLLNNIGDRLVFRVEANAVSNRFLGCDKAFKLPQTPKGRAIYRGSKYQGSPNELDTVITPLLPHGSINDLIALKEEIRLWNSIFQT